MPPRQTADTTGPVRGDAPPDAAYEHDFYSWSLEQARLVRDGRWDEIDREHLADAIESLGAEQFDKLEGALRMLLIHILKWDHQPDKRGPSWTLSIKEQCAVLRGVLAANPGLKVRLDEALARAYEHARTRTARETGLREEAFPPACPYGFEDIILRPFAA